MLSELNNLHEIHTDSVELSDVTYFRAEKSDVGTRP